MERASFKMELTSDGEFTVYNSKGIPIASVFRPEMPMKREYWSFAPGITEANKTRLIDLYVKALNLQGFMI